LWDRVKVLLILVLVWFILVWSAMANNPLIGFTDGMRIESRSGAWVFVLIGLELIRQLHFLVSEHWAGYHRFWTKKFFGRLDGTTHRRLSPWTRYRMWRVVVWVFWIAVIAVIAVSSRRRRRSADEGPDQVSDPGGGGSQRQLPQRAPPERPVGQPGHDAPAHDRGEGGEPERGAEYPETGQVGEQRDQGPDGEGGKGRSRRH